MSIIVPMVPRPAGWDPKAKPVRYCPIHLRHVHVEEACPRFCGVEFTDECKFADRDPRREEMMVAQPIVIAEGEDVAWVESWRREHPLPREGRH